MMAVDGHFGCYLYLFEFAWKREVIINPAKIDRIKLDGKGLFQDHYVSILYITR